jgi:Na+/proline symporter
MNLHLQALDFTVLAVYFFIVLTAGFWFTRLSARGGQRSYFLGENKQKWWMLAASGSASNYSVDGTVWNISMLMVLGMLSWYTTLVWWMPCEIVLMAFMAIWIRRTGAMTAADLNTVRFGTDTGAKAARIGFAVLMNTFSVMTLCMSYVMLYKFATTFGFPNGHLVAMLLIGTTGIYVIFGGFRGVVVTELFQNVLLVGVSFVIGFLCVANYDAKKLEAAISHQSLTTQEKLVELDKLKAATRSQAELAVIDRERVSVLKLALRNDAAQKKKDFDAAAEAEKKDVELSGVLLAAFKLEKLEAQRELTRDKAKQGELDAKIAALVEGALGQNTTIKNEKPEVVTYKDWSSFQLHAEPKIGRYKDSAYSGWQDFAGAALAMSIVGLIGSFGGAGGRYGEQRFLAAQSAKHAAWQAALWQGMAIPRWVVTAGVAFLAYTMFKDQTVNVVKVIGEHVVYSDPDNIYPLYVKSDLLMPGLRGLVLATLAASYMSTFSSEVNAAASIFVHDIFQPLFEKDNEKAKGNTYASYAATAGIVIAALGCGYMFTQYSSLNGVWGWMLGGLITCVVVPLAMRWYWGRMNGWGFAMGCLVGFVPSLMLLSKQFVAKTCWVQSIPNAYFTYAILILSFATCVIVSLMTKPVDAKYIDPFYCRVRPFGFWGGIKERALASGEPCNTPLALKWIPVNVVVGIIASYALYMTPVYCMGRWFGSAAMSFGIFLACAACLYFTWFKTLPKD